MFPFQRTTVVLVLTCFLGGQLAQAVVPACRRILSPGSSSSPVTLAESEVYSDPAAFLRDAQTWSEQLVTAGRAAPAEFKMPVSFKYKNTAIDRLNTAEAADKLRKGIFEAVPDLLTEIHATKSTPTDLDSILTRFQGIIRNHFGAGEGVTDIVTEQEAKLQTQWQALRGDTTLRPFKLGELIDAQKIFTAEFAKTKTRFSAEAQKLLDEGTMMGAAFGNIGSQIILSTIGVQAASYRSVLALTLLHPLTDNALDQGWNVGTSMQRITRLLQGEKLPHENAYEEVVFTLIGDIFEDFPQKTHPLLATYLQQLHQAQLESQVVQKSKTPVTDEKLLELTARKGAYTALSLAYLSMGTLKKDETEFFYKSGVMFQLGDDLLDVEEDQADGVQTFWTRALGSRKKMEHALSLFSSLQNFAENDAKRVLQDNSLSPYLRNNLRLSYVFYLFSTLFHPSLDSEVYPIIKSYVPLSPGNTRSVAFSLFKALEQQSDVNPPEPGFSATVGFFGRLYDRHFLGGQYTAFAERTEGQSPRSTYRVNSWNPFFQVIKFGNRAEAFFSWLLAQRRNSGGSSFKNMAIFTTGLWLYFYIPGLIHDESLREMSKFAEVIGALGFLGLCQGDGPERDCQPRVYAERRRLLVPFLALGFNAILRIIDYLK